MKPYEEHVRNLSPLGQMEILKYDDSTGLMNCISKIKNPYEFRSGGWFSKNIYAELSELEWVKKAIQYAKDNQADGVDYYDTDCEIYRRTEIWRKR